MGFLRRDDLKLGVILGLIGPVIGLFGYYYWKFSLYSFSDFMTALRLNKPLVTAITIPCLLVNIIFFTYFINTKKDQTARGIFVVTLIFAVTALLFKIWG
jgi:hypothetical protein